MKKVKVIRETNRETFESSINKAIKDGWELHGEMSVVILQLGVIFYIMLTKSK